MNLDTHYTILTIYVLNGRFEWSENDLTRQLEAQKHLRALSAAELDSFLFISFHFNISKISMLVTGDSGGVSIFQGGHVSSRLKMRTSFHSVDAHIFLRLFNPGEREPTSRCCRGWWSRIVEKTDREGSGYQPIDQMGNLLQSHTSKTLVSSKLDLYVL